jgi:membrane associated rhomboid family serine protease
VLPPLHRGRPPRAAPLDVAAELERLRSRVRLLTVAFALFVALHVLIVPLLPQLFGHAPEASVGALVLGCVLLALVVSRRVRPPRS